MQNEGLEALRSEVAQISEAKRQADKEVKQLKKELQVLAFVYAPPPTHSTLTAPGFEIDEK